MKNKSFTLIELLVVIVIIGILAGVIIVSTLSSIEKANIAKSQVFSESIKNKLMLNLISEFKFDEGLGNTTKDSWSVSFTGSLIGFDVNTTAGYGDSHNYGWMSKNNCISGTCLKFDTAQYIDSINNYPAIGSNNFTWDFWGKTSESAQSVIYLSVSGITNWQGKLDISHATTNKALFYIRNSCYRYSVKKVNDNKWHYIVGVFDRNSVSPDIYIDGVLDNGNNSFSECSTVGNIPSGSLLLANTNFKGSVDEIKMYTEALGSSQIKQNYIAGLNSLLASESISKEEYNERINSLALYND